MARSPLLNMNTWTTCAVCGAVVADPALHATWHDTIEGGRSA